MNSALNRKPKYWLLAASIWIWSAILGLAVEPVALAAPGICEGAFFDAAKQTGTHPVTSAGAASGTAAESLPPGPKLPAFLAVTSPQYYQDAFTPIGIHIPGSFVRHIFHADVDMEIIQIRGVDQFVMMLAGGLHMRSSLAAFLKERADVAEILVQQPARSVTHSNGVLEINFPNVALARTTTSSRKTFFPESWQNGDVMAAIDEVYDHGQIEGGDGSIKGPPQPGDRLKYNMIGLYKGVRVKISFYNNRRPELHSVFPLVP